MKTASLNIFGSANGTDRNDSDRQFEIHTLEWFRQHRLTIEHPGQSGVIEIFYMISVTKSDIIEDGNCIIIKDRKRQELSFERDAVGYYITMSFNQFCIIQHEIRFLLPDDVLKSDEPVSLKVATESTDAIDDILSRMHGEYENFYSLRFEMLTALCKIFLLYINRRMADTRVLRSRERELLDKFMNLVSTHFSVEKTISYYAGELCVTPGHLSQVVKRVSGFRPSHWIQQYIVAEAKRKGLQSNISLKQIAYDLGFEDAAHFSKFFKSFSGYNFTEFRRMS